MVVYLLAHFRPYEYFEGHNFKLVGVYSSRENAETAIQRQTLLPGFRQYPNHFKIIECVLDRVNWDGLAQSEEALLQDESIRLS